MATKIDDILGINARSAVYLRTNKKRARERADDKIKTKKVLKKANIPHPRLLGKLSSLERVDSFEWLKLKDPFVIKPVQGLGGEGILLIRKRGKYAGEWWTMDGRKINISDLRLHATDIVEGRYSRNNNPDTAMIEERVRIHPKFKKLSKFGTPDIRLIVFNRVPVMAMVRIPTEESKGKANLEQGAIGLGLDVATGITTYGLLGKEQQIRYFPGTNRKVNGIRIPHWMTILKIAAKTQMVSKLGYLSVDFLIDKEKGPLVLELNDQPGLSIQLANHAGLRRRLERVRGLEVESGEKGAKIARALFASSFAKRVKFTPGKRKVVGIFEDVKVRTGKKKWVEVKAKIDTGAYSTSIDRKLAKELGLLEKSNVLWEKKYRSSLGTQKRTVIQLKFKLKGQRYTTRASLTNRQRLRRKLLIGRRDLKDFLVNPSLVNTR